MNQAVPLRRSELRNFGLVLGALFAVIFGVVPMLRGHTTPLWPWVVAVILWAAALAVPAALRYPHRGWSWLGSALGWLNTRVILTAVFAVAIVPIGVLMRLLGRDRMGRRFDQALETYRVEVKPRSNTSMERPF